MGIGSTLFKEIEAFCFNSNCSKIMLLSSAERSDSHTFFEKQGFKGSVKRGFVKYRTASLVQVKMLTSALNDAAGSSWTRNKLLAV
ncbi:GNAT family N-acetyltransferase [Shewanella sp.]|uniref:GNAT family N-acetyltransferase n=1 Tax=Shewanella sp. TaxID=50422 RepID=UPI0040540741